MLIVLRAPTYSPWLNPNQYVFEAVKSVFTEANTHFGYSDRPRQELPHVALGAATEADGIGSICRPRIVEVCGSRLAEHA